MASGGGLNETSKVSLLAKLSDMLCTSGTNDIFVQELLAKLIIKIIIYLGLRFLGKFIAFEHKWRK